MKHFKFETFAMFLQCSEGKTTQFQYPYEAKFAPTRK